MKGCARVAVLAAVALHAAPALAANRTAKPAQSEMGLGMTQFLNGDFKAALAHFNAALPDAHGGPETAQLHLLRGQCFGALGDTPDARKAFELALGQDADATLDAVHSSPEMVSLLAEVRSSLHAELTLLGSGTSASLDSTDLGPLPIHQAIPIGRHTLEVTSPDRKFDEKQQIVARPGDSIALTFDVSASPTAAAPQPSSTSPGPARSEAAATKAPVAHEEQPSSVVPPDTGLGGFGFVGAAFDVPDKGAAFEAGAGVTEQIFAASLSGVWGAAAGLVVRGGVRVPEVVGPLGLYALAEVPLFFANGASVGLGAQAGVSARFSIIEPYVGVSGQHFLATPNAQTPSNYFLIPVGVRVFLP